MKFKHLILSYLSYAVLFYIFNLYAPALKIFTPATSMMIGAVFVTVLSMYAVYGFSCLKQHRTVYLLLGVIGAACVMYSAAPLVKRAKTLSVAASFAVRPIEELSKVNLKIQKYVGVTCFNNDSLINVRNKCYSFVCKAIGSEIPEKDWNILLLAFSQLLLASGIGIWIGEGIDKISHLIPVALVAGLADVWSVSAGATSVIILSPTINYFFLRFPIFGSSEIPMFIGLTDFLFFALFFQAVIRFELGYLKNILLLGSSFLITAALAIYCRTGLPVLPFMGVLFVVGNYKSLFVDKKELKQIAAFIVVAGLVFAAISFYLK